ncbi:MAG: GAF domain-containing protein [Planctomycetes bacterium]|nr:GAF domain-containing protein [Planctomycetota bacterium]
MQSDGVLTLQAGHALSPQSSLPDRFELGEGMVGEAARSERCTLRKVSDDPIQLQTGIGVVELESVLFVPLSWQGTLVAILALGRSGSFTEDEVALAEKTREAAAAYLQTAQDKQRTEQPLDRPVFRRRRLQAAQDRQGGRRQGLPSEDLHSRRPQASAESVPRLGSARRASSTPAARSAATERLEAPQVTPSDGFVGVRCQRVDAERQGANESPRPRL